MSSPLLVERAADALILRFNRPEARNAINLEVLDLMWGALRNPDESVIILESAEPGGPFSAGGDLKQSPATLSEMSDSLFELYLHLGSLPSVVVAVANGPVVGAGLQLYLAADLRVAGDGLRIRTAGLDHGFVGTAWSLTSLVGRGAALRLILDDGWIDRAEADQLGLVDIAAPDPHAAARAFAARIAGHDRRDIRLAKRLVLAASVSREVLWAEQAANVDIPLRRDRGHRA
jgi:Enoyl-CoA hydratase/carnithine racemase